MTYARDIVTIIVITATVLFVSCAPKQAEKQVLRKTHIAKGSECQITTDDKGMQHITCQLKTDEETGQ